MNTKDPQLTMFDKYHIYQGTCLQCGTRSGWRTVEEDMVLSSLQPTYPMMFCWPTQLLNADQLIVEENVLNSMAGTDVSGCKD